MEESELDSSLKLIAKFSLVIFVGVLISKLSLYFYRIIIARYYGPEAYGLFSLALMMLSFFVAVSSFGLSEGILRYISFYRGNNQMPKAKYILKLSTTILLLSGTMGAVLLFVLAKPISEIIFHSSDLIIFLQISSIIIPFFIFSSIYLSVIRAFEKFSWYSFITNILQNVVKILALVVLIYFGSKSSGIMYTYLIGILAMFFVSYILCKYKIVSIFGRFSIPESDKRKARKELFLYSIPLMFSSILITFYYWIDSFVIGYFIDIHAVGIYNAAFPIALLFTLIQDIFIQILYPVIIKGYARKNMNLVKELSKQVSKWIFIFNLPLFIIIFLFPGAVINLIFGSEYLLATNSLRILSVGAFISSFTALLSSLILMKGKSNLVLVNFIITSSLNFVLDLFLVPKLGIIGAAIATSIVWTIFTIVLFIEVRRIFGFIPLRKKMVGITLISIIPAVLVLVIRKYTIINSASLILLGVFFLSIYILLIIISKSFDRNDLMIIRAFKNKIFPNKVYK